MLRNRFVYDLRMTLIVSSIKPLMNLSNMSSGSMNCFMGSGMMDAKGSMMALHAGITVLLKAGMMMSLKILR